MCRLLANSPFQKRGFLLLQLSGLHEGESDCQAIFQQNSDTLGFNLEDKKGNCGRPSESRMPRFNYRPAYG